MSVLDYVQYIFTDKETRNKRESICNECASKKDVRCEECGCFLIALRKIETAKCPLKKW
jgi:hypothetical protein